MIVAVFGTASGLPGDAIYEQALRLGQGLAEAGFDVMTGGYCGTMEAVCRGANESGMQSFGVSCSDIETWRPQGVNPWVKTEIKTENLNRRLEVLTREADAMIALPGGIGTLVEVLLSLNLMAVESMPLKPLILIGEEWQNSFNAFFNFNGAYIKEKDRALLHFAKDEEEALTLLKSLLRRS